jgi:hypothetical protein
MVQDFRDDLLKRCSRVLAAKVLTSLKSLISDAQRRGLVGQNAATAVRIGASKRDRRKLKIGRDIPTKEEVTADTGRGHRTGAGAVGDRGVRRTPCERDPWTHLDRYRFRPKDHPRAPACRSVEHHRVAEILPVLIGPSPW